jgi:hypothetical protein
LDFSASLKNFSQKRTSQVFFLTYEKTFFSAVTYIFRRKYAIKKLSNFYSQDILYLDWSTLVGKKWSPALKSISKIFYLKNNELFFKVHSTNQ